MVVDGLQQHRIGDIRVFYFQKWKMETGQDLK
jgi:hypothetical protein